ncbi:isochorismatase family hydrolase, putative [Talaromyces stipitatus ATCC 10500]|uniref:Isochorismatase family hydrolase, putative n=1 Tax=Talaromyces stipitatus (strain ATCC 10500 / CBS 375.48 / QM 6759 / NRRL 1006) TaxID=441959 RepID=B8M2M3_TALSN|nr:isochorismatase family hydrolase, putative [Talaromyces stipitatus ATCC 10500]EED21934.1 isochorismatase family hydrolase, putative [Talaromyces stipitatus ATCC 10500]
MANLSARASRISGFLSKFEFAEENDRRLTILSSRKSGAIFREHIYEFPKVVSTTQKLLKASATLEVPVYITTQNKARLGDTVSELLSQITPDNGQPGNTVIANIDKTAFSMYTPDIVSQYHSATKNKSDKDPEQKLDAIIVGIETHICVTQTTLDLLEAGHRVYIVADAVSSVNSEERGIALNRLRDAGAIVTTSESLIFEMLRDAKSPGFKSINGLIKEYKEDTKNAVKILCKY